MKSLVRDALEQLNLLRADHRDALILTRLQSVPVKPVRPTRAHLDRAIAWIKRAQDAVPTGGVSWGYRACRRRGSKAALGWQPAYPETTGYTIETMLRYGQRTGDHDCIERAHRMADWETSIQLADGGIQGGPTGATPVESSTFVTGQVLFGWLCAYEQFGNPAYLEAGRRAGDFLVSCLGEDGGFVRGYSHFCSPGPKAYEARTGWALAELGRVTDDPKYTEAARRIGRFALGRRRPNGWFDTNDLDDHSRPLTHTVGYVLEGLLATAWLVGENSFEEAVADSLGRIDLLVGEDGFLAGRWTADWKPAVDSCCLTGSAQIAFVCLRLHSRRADATLARLAARLLGMVSATQLNEGFDPGLLGGIHGSYPFRGEYGQYCVLNWATKFYADAMMSSLDLPEAFR